MYKLKLFWMSLRKKRHIIYLLGVIIIFSVLIFLVYNFENENENIDEEEIPNKIKKPVEKKDEFYKVRYPHWDHMPITYKVINPEKCDGRDIEEVKKAFKILENATEGLITFEETEKIPDFELKCVGVGIPKELEDVEECKNIQYNYYKESPNFYKEGYISRFTQKLISSKLIERNENKTTYEICYEYGNYNPMTLVTDEVMPIISKNVIKKAHVNLYLYGGGSRCTVFPTREVHEVLHGFGFAHSLTNEEAARINFALSSGIYSEIPFGEAIEIARDNMYPYFNCAHQLDLDEKYITCLKKIYSNWESEGDCKNVRFL
ncbi:hypothetical protein GF386_02205 [Candidatus Pacearchaeota archaeon]|nr:hypothetical protein [Candidatus Pacearchaeota archaeon]MBD3282981.1 hypothetical protein [Candidatus Pacearchaeota archaeon]